MWVANFHTPYDHLRLSGRSFTMLLAGGWWLVQALRSTAVPMHRWAIGLLVYVHVHLFGKGNVNLSPSHSVHLA